MTQMTRGELKDLRLLLRESKFRESSFVTGHDFSRAAEAANQAGL
jgi:hypothetical protein